MKDREKGFTLMEALVSSILIFSILTVIVIVYGNVHKTSLYVEQKESSLLAINQSIESIKNANSIEDIDRLFEGDGKLLGCGYDLITKQLGFDNYTVDVNEVKVHCESVGGHDYPLDQVVYNTNITGL